MKQFQKYGVAAAVASLAAGAVAQEVSNTESGDLAIIPYYTVLDGKNTGMHIINTTDSYSGGQGASASRCRFQGRARL